MKNAIKILEVVLFPFFVIIFISSCRNTSRKESDSFTNIPVTLPYKFKKIEAERLSVKAFNLRKTKEYDAAIHLYHKAIEIEPDNPKLFFDLSSCYFETNKLKQAISVLDTAIILDSTCATCYSNRGLYYYNLYEDSIAINDLNKAIELDSGNYVYYSNIALAYYSNKKINQACESFRKAKKLGLKINSATEQTDLIEIEKICN